MALVACAVGMLGAAPAYADFSEHIADFAEQFAVVFASWGGAWTTATRSGLLRKESRRVP